ncbi:MAG: hypothetical protein KAR35_09680 [Candidatus Heimdallarchaeota archaeon]|nr:hypothetical protein [Candidatus Heimdallarchaeota archaeon]MCK5049627.1 hypothetical protein [Candidatus Heimdallarchaeota archaeon]
MKKVFIVLASSDKVVHQEVSLVLALNFLIRNKVEKLRLMIGEPVLKACTTDEDFLENIRVIHELGAELYTCESGIKRNNAFELVEETGIEIVKIADLIMEMLEEGWEQLSF